MKKLALLVMGLTLASAFANGGAKQQPDSRGPVKLPIHHADPWAVKAMLEGSSISQPELSTIRALRGGGAASGGNNAQGASSAYLQDGFLVVNPTDNSLWWYPKKR